MLDRRIAVKTPPSPVRVGTVDEQDARPSAFAEATADRRSAKRGGWSTSSGRADTGSIIPMSAERTSQYDRDMTIRLIVALMMLILLSPSMANPEPVNVRFSEGLVHGFLTLKTLDGEQLAEGD